MVEWGAVQSCGKPATGSVNVTASMASSVPSRFEMRCDDHNPFRITAATGAPTTGDAVWEPIQFVKGDRVRVKLSGECRWIGQDWTDHTESVDGAQGTIFSVVDRWVFTDHHRYFVDFDEPWPLGVFGGVEKPCPHGCFAASELIAIAARPGAVDGEAG